MPPHGPIRLDVLALDQDRLLPERRGQARERLVTMGLEAAAHPLDRPEKIDHGRTGRGEQARQPFETRRPLRRGDISSAHEPEGDPHRRRHADRRGASNRHSADRRRHLLRGPQGQVDLLLGKEALVEQDDPLVGPGDRLEHDPAMLPEEVVEAQ